MDHHPTPKNTCFPFLFPSDITWTGLDYVQYLQYVHLAPDHPLLTLPRISRICSICSLPLRNSYFSPTGPSPAQRQPGISSSMLFVPNKKKMWTETSLCGFPANFLVKKWKEAKLCKNALYEPSWFAIAVAQVLINHRLGSNSRKSTLRQQYLPPKWLFILSTKNQQAGDIVPMPIA